MTLTREAGQLCGPCGALPFGSVNRGLQTLLRFVQVASLRSAKSATPRMLGNPARIPFQKQFAYSSEVFGCPSTRNCPKSDPELLEVPTAYSRKTCGMITSYLAARVRS